MALPQHIVRRGQRLYYRRAYPRDLWRITGRGRSFTLALRTDSLSEAIRARPAAERAYFEAIDKARAELARREERVPLTKKAAEALAVQWFLRGLDLADDLRTTPTPEKLPGDISNAEWIIGETRRALGEGELQDEKRLAGCLREEAGYASEPVAEAALVRLLGRAAVAAAEVERARLVGDYGARPKDPLFAAAMEAPRVVVKAPSVASSLPTADVEEGPTVADLERVYREVRLPRLAEGSRLGYEPVFRLLRDVLGADARLAKLGHDDGVRLFQAVEQLPANAQKRAVLKGLGTLEAIETGKRLGLPTLSAKTINDKYVAYLGSIFRFAHERGWMAVNPVQGLRARDPVADRDRREPFGARLKVLFEAPPWSAKDTSEPLHYWGPLLALYHGLRLGEVAGLQIRDVTEENETPMLLLRAGKRKLKSASSRREMPVHPELVRLGFLKFAHARRKEAAGDELLFAGQKAYAREQWGRGLGEWFRKRVAALGIKGRKLGMHSLRHDFRDALREAEVPEDVAHYLMGHAMPGMAAIYGGRPTLARLKVAMGKVRYKGISLSA